MTVEYTRVVRPWLLARRRFLSAFPVLARALWHIFLFYLIIAWRDQIFFGYPLLVEGIIQALCSEKNRRMQRDRLHIAHETSQTTLEAGTCGSEATCIATVVGYREDPSTFRKCLESYAANFDTKAKAICVGIDGNENEDLQMQATAEEVFGKRLITINLERSFGTLVRGQGNEIKNDKSIIGNPDDSMEDWQINSLIGKATEILHQHSALICSEANPLPICLTQPHHSKKEIMFTTFIFAMALCRVNHADYIWSSDSDSWIYPGTIATTIDCVHTDSDIAGSCTGLTIHNSGDSMLSSMVAATYEADLALVSGLLSSCNSTDCQSGPCATFRVEALRRILLPWYNQIVLGQRPIVNEDRHLTTRLLLMGAKITYNPLALVATDTPTTIPRWVAQQVRWARSTAIESASHPTMFLLRHPILFIYTLRRLIVPIVNFAIVSRYMLTGVGSQFSSLTDMAARIALCGLWATWRQRKSWTGFWAHGTSQLFLQVPQTAFLFWAFATMFDSGWGTPMRSSGEIAKSRTKRWVSQHAASLMTTSIWVAMVSSAFVRYIGTEFMLLHPVYCATGGFFGGMAAFAIAIMTGM